MLIISDNSALSALAEMGMAWVLPKVAGRVTIPAAVAREGLHPRAPAALRALMANPPDWLKIVPDPGEVLPETELLGPGEAAAIALAWSHRASFAVNLFLLPNTGRISKREDQIRPRKSRNDANHTRKAILRAVSDFSLP